MPKENATSPKRFFRAPTVDVVNRNRKLAVCGQGQFSIANQKVIENV